MFLINKRRAGKYEVANYLQRPRDSSNGRYMYILDE